MYSSVPSATAVFVGPASIKFWKTFIKPIPRLHSLILGQSLFLNFCILGKSHTDFIGHCCELNEVKKQMKLEKKISTNQIWNSTVLTTNTPMTDRMLHIPKLQFSTPSALDGDIDVHALGSQKDACEGLWHAVPSRDCAHSAAEHKIHPCHMPHDNIFALLMKREYKLGMTYSTGLPFNGQLSTICVDIYQIKNWYHFDEQQKGSNMM